MLLYPQNNFYSQYNLVLFTVSLWVRFATPGRAVGSDQASVVGVALKYNQFGVARATPSTIASPNAPPEHCEQVHSHAKDGVSTLAMWVVLGATLSAMLPT